MPSGATFTNKLWLCLLLTSCFISACGSKHRQVPVIDAWHQVKSSSNIHIVQSGDTLYSIAWRYGLDYRELAMLNFLQFPYALAVGQPIYLKKIDRRHVTKIYQAKSSMGDRPTTSAAEVDPNFIPNELRFPNPKEWVWPATGDIIQKFAGNNKGVDIKGVMGEPVRAAAMGKVVYAGNGLRGYGELLIIKHNAEYLSAYAHNRTLRVKEGDLVTPSQIIAEMGDSEADQVMLHFEIRKAGKPVDPLQLLPAR